LRAESRLNILDQFGPDDVLGVHLVDDNHAGHIRLGRQLEHFASIGFDAGRSANDEDRRLGGRDRFDCGACEIGIARRIDDIDQLSGVCGVNRRRKNRVLVFFLFVVVVARACLVVHAAEPVCRAGLVQYRLGQRGLAAASMT
jgi:hypothetical protein